MYPLARGSGPYTRLHSDATLHREGAHVTTNSPGRHRVSRGTSARRATGAWCAAFGAVALAALVWIWALSQPRFNPPDSLRIVGSLLLPVGLAGSLASAYLARGGPRRVGVVLGLSLGALTVVGFVVLLVTMGR